MIKVAFKVLTFILFCFVVNVLASNTAEAIISGQTVELSVPDTSILVSGSSARQALVTIEVNDVVVASTTSDSNGEFSSVIAGLTPGVQKISVQYEVDGRKSLEQTKNVSLQPQQQTPVSFLLPPILYNAGPTLVSVSENIILEGYSKPNSTVTLNSSTGLTLQTVTNQTGQYVFSISGGQFFLQDVSFFSRYRINGQDSTLSNVVLVKISGLESEQGGSEPDIIVNPFQPSSPVVLFPEGSQAYIDGDSVVFRGQAQAGSQIIAYANGQVIGSVLVNQNGEWEFYYTSLEERVIFQFSTCVDGSCSLTSQSIEVQFGLILGACNIDLRLDNYRYWDITTKDYIILNSDTFPVNLEVSIDWDDGPAEKFSYDAGSPFQYKHSYSQPGVYNGSVRVAYENCSQERFFSVIVNNEVSSTPFSGDEIRNMIIILVTLSSIGFYVNRRTVR